MKHMTSEVDVLSPPATNYCRFSADDKPQLIVVIDTEEEFDWMGGFSRRQVAVTSMRSIEKVQNIFDQYHVKPVYVVDYPIASQPEGYERLQIFHREGRCVIGAHLHPWVNPPFIEEVTRWNSFPGNLPCQLESEKLKRLSSCIEEKFGQRPTIYKAGRYGVGANTAGILLGQGYEVDLSVCPRMNYSHEGGPDFSASTAQPYWIVPGRLLELPLTSEFYGLLKKWGVQAHRILSLPHLSRLHLIGLSARLGILNKVWLSPEGYLPSEQKKLVKAMMSTGSRAFSYAFHSPSVEPGHTPYVRTQRDLELFLSRIRDFFDFFFGELGGQPTTPAELKRRCAMVG